jgi:hypothetical protein
VSDAPDDRSRAYPRQLGTSTPGSTWVRTTRPAVPRPPEGGDAAAAETVPVYALEPGGALGVPTGLVFVRLAEDADVAAADRAFAAAGYEIARRPDWAPHTAWLRAAGGRVDDALAGIGRLAALAGVAAVEAQVLVERRSR